MFYLFLILIVMAVTLTALLWVGTYFFQGYIYTEPSPGIFWQAPVAAALLTIGYAIWSVAIVIFAKSPADLPYNVVHKFSPKEDMEELKGTPAKKIWAIKADRKKTGADKDGEVIAYELTRGDRGEFSYKSKVGKSHTWQPDGVIAIEIEKPPDGAKLRFDLVPADESANREFASRDGWVITELPGAGGGPNAIPYKFRWGRWFINLFFNIGHFAVWFVGLWLVLRFQWAQALGFAFVLWLVATLLVVPLLLEYAGGVAASRRTPTAMLWNLSVNEPRA